MAKTTTLAFPGRSAPNGVVAAQAYTSLRHALQMTPTRPADAENPVSWVAAAQLLDALISLEEASEQIAHPGAVKPLRAEGGAIGVTPAQLDLLRTAWKEQMTRLPLSAAREAVFLSNLLGLLPAA